MHGTSTLSPACCSLFQLGRCLQLVEHISLPVTVHLLVSEQQQVPQCVQRYRQRDLWVLQRALHTLVLLGLQAKGEICAKHHEWHRL